MTRKGIIVENVADAIVRLPQTLHASGGVSMYDLAARTGYFEHYNLIGEFLIKQRLSVVPDLVDEWLAYSEDKRTGSGWYFRLIPHHKYEVGYFGGSTSQSTSSVLSDKFDACAKFIKQEMEAIRSE